MTAAGKMGKNFKSVKSIKFKGFKKRDHQIVAVTSDVFDLEQQFILRLPPDAAAQLHEDLGEASTVQLKEKLSIEMDPDMRHGRVRYGPDIFFAKLLDLPCVIESMKTLDKKTFYKTSDICQILVCKTEEEWVHEEKQDSPKKKEKDKRYMWNHGLTPPLKNVRKRRFRKTLKKKYMDQPEIEKEVRRLFRSDSDAIDVKWEIIIDDEKSMSDTGMAQAMEAGGPSSSQGHMAGADTNTSSMDVASFFGELSSSEEEEEEDKDVNIMDSDGEDRGGQQQQRQREEEQVPEARMSAQERAELQDKLKVLTSQLEEIRERRSHQEDQLATTEEETLKGEMQVALNSLVKEENEKETEMETLSAMLNQ